MIFDLTEKEADLTISALAQLPYHNVASLIAKIHQQAQSQMAPSGLAPSGSRLTEEADET